MTVLSFKTWGRGWHQWHSGMLLRVIDISCAVGELRIKPVSTDWRANEYINLAISASNTHQSYHTLNLPSPATAIDFRTSFSWRKYTDLFTFSYRKHSDLITFSCKKYTGLINFSYWKKGGKRRRRKKGLVTLSCKKQQPTDFIIFQTENRHTDLTTFS